MTTNNNTIRSLVSEIDRERSRDRGITVPVEMTAPTMNGIIMVLHVPPNRSTSQLCVSAACYSCRFCVYKTSDRPKSSSLSSSSVRGKIIATHRTGERSKRTTMHTAKRRHEISFTRLSATRLRPTIPELFSTRPCVMFYCYYFFINFVCFLFIIFLYYFSPTTPALWATPGESLHNARTREQYRLRFISPRPSRQI